jgi:hypothetical protein
MATNHVLYTGRHVEVTDDGVLLEISTMDGLNKLPVRSKEIVEIADMVKNKVSGRLSTGKTITVFTTSNNVGLISINNTKKLLLTFNEFQHLLCIINGITSLS